MDGMTKISNNEDTVKAVHDVIKDAKAKAAVAQAVTQEQLPFAAEEKPAEPTRLERLAIIPYQIISFIKSLDNIYECRLFGWLLAKAQSVLKLYNKDLRDINMQHALDMTRVTLPGRYLLNPNDKNYKNIVKAFELATKTIDYERDGTTYKLNVIAFPELTRCDGKVMASFVIHRHVWQALLDFSKGHRLFSLPTYIQLTNKYAIILYLLCSQQDQLPQRYGTMRLRQILGCDQLKGYDRGNNLVQKILEPCRRELMAKAPYYYDYSLAKTGRSNRITEVILIPHLNEQPTAAPEGVRRTAATLRLRLDEEVRRYCTDNFKIDPAALERLEGRLIDKGDKAAQLEWLAGIKDRVLVKRVKNPAGYLTRALK